jgi:hypothetical protein
MVIGIPLPNGIKGHQILASVLTCIGLKVALTHWMLSKLSGHIIRVHLKTLQHTMILVGRCTCGTGASTSAIFQELKIRFRDIYIERDAEDKPSNLPSVMNTIKYYNEKVSMLK